MGAYQVYLNVMEEIRINKFKLKGESTPSALKRLVREKLK